MQTPATVTMYWSRNKTIVMRDKTANKSVEVVINEARRTVVGRCRTVVGRSDRSDVPPQA